jgi:mono/diheme cytochrome c family protein
MKRVLKWLGIIVGVCALGAGGFALFVQIRGIPKYDLPKVELTVKSTPERVVRGRRFAQVLCSGCHLEPGSRTLAGRRMSDAPPEFGEIYSRNITKHPTAGIGGWTDAELAVLLRTGLRRDGQYLPPYMPKFPHLSDEDLHSIIAFLRSDDALVKPSDHEPPQTKPSFLTKFLTVVAFKPLPYPKAAIVAPPATERIAFGRYLTFGLDCYGCHSADFKTVDVANPERSAGYLGGGNTVIDLTGAEVKTANLTFDPETGIGKWSAEDFVRALREGFRPDGSLIRYPMTPAPGITDEEARALYAYFQSLPKLRNAVARSVPKPPSNDPGEVAYYRHGCASCHGKTGVGYADLRPAVRAIGSDDALLRKMIDQARSVRAGTEMPNFAGRIPPSDYAPLLSHLRKLAK